MLLGPGPRTQRAPVARDPWLPTGSPLFSLHRPDPVDEPPACSLTRPVCVHRGAGVSAERALSALGALEQAYERIVLAMGLPAPLGDLGRGTTDALDLYLEVGSEVDVEVGHDPPEVDFADRASAFCIARAPESADLARAVTQCVGEAVAWRLDASESPHHRRAFASQLWLVSGSPTSADVAAIDDVQQNPQRAVLASTRTPNSEGAALFLEYLDATRSQTAPGLLSGSLFALSSGKTAPGASHWENHPDLYDVLRESLRDQPSAVAELMSEFAVARAFLGDRDDGSHLPTLGWAGAFGRVRFDWVIDFSSLPRRVASAHPIEPTGSVYVWLDLDQVPPDATLGMRAEWEAPVDFAWVMVRVGPDGREQSRVVVPYKQRATSAEHSVEYLGGSAAVLVIGTSLGGVDASHPFDPDVAPYEPHGCTVYLAKL